MCPCKSQAVFWALFGSLPLQGTVDSERITQLLKGKHLPSYFMLDVRLFEPLLGKHSELKLTAHACYLIQCVKIQALPFSQAKFPNWDSYFIRFYA